MTYLLRKVGLNSGGYDCWGMYWGVGKPLYQWTTHNSEDDLALYPSN